MQVGKIGEERLLRLIQRVVRGRGHLLVGIGDDGLVLKDGRTVLTTDAYAQGVHFDLSYLSYYDVGRRCACAALSDLVAMGAEPVVMLVALALPRRTSTRAVQELYQGLEQVCAELNCEIGGGDIIAFDQLVLGLSALGKTRRPLLRSGAEPGDLVYVTGYTGLAETGRLLLVHKLSIRFKACGGELAIERHRHPLPRLQVLQRVRRGISALIDTSDGLGSDVRHLSQLSGVRVVIQAEKIPVHPVTRELCQVLDIDINKFVLSSGEDYELLFTSKRRLGSTVAGVPVNCIGWVEKGAGVEIENQGRRSKLRIRGYDHLK